MRRLVLVLGLLALLAAYLLVSRATMPGARFGCTPNSLPFGLGSTAVGYQADEYCGAQGPEWQVRVSVSGRAYNATVWEVQAVSGAAAIAQVSDEVTEPGWHEAVWSATKEQ